MKVIGLTGLVGSGKTEVADYVVRAFDAIALKTDLIAADFTMKGNICYEPIVKLLGKECLREDGEIDRSKMADIIFDESNATLLSDVNKIIHGAVIDFVKKEVDIFRKKNKNGRGLMVIESALLFKSGLNNYCDECWYVSVSYETRRERLKNSRGYSYEKTDSILKNQEPDLELRRLCDIIINNDGDFSDTEKAVNALLVND